MPEIMNICQEAFHVLDRMFYKRKLQSIYIVNYVVAIRYPEKVQYGIYMPTWYTSHPLYQLQARVIRVFNHVSEADAWQNNHIMRKKIYTAILKSNNSFVLKLNN